MNHEKLFLKMSEKYEKGAKEHDNDLDDMNITQLAKESLNEAIDMCFYLQNMIEKLEKLQDKIK